MDRMEANRKLWEIRKKIVDSKGLKAWNVHEHMEKLIPEVKEEPVQKSVLTDVFGEGGYELWTL